MRFWNSVPMFSGIFLHEILSQFRLFSTCSLWYNALLIIGRCLTEIQTLLNKYYINKLMVKYAKPIQKRKTKKREQLKNIESMKYL